jgi:RNA polymerase sigma-70 factor (ECF subfamily)
MAPPGPYCLQATISAEHARSIDGASTNWDRIADLYRLLQDLDPSPVIGLNRAVAVAMAGRTEQGLQMIDRLAEQGLPETYRYLHIARGELLSRLDRPDEAAAAYQRALELSQNEVDRNFVKEKLAEMSARKAQNQS